MNRKEEIIMATLELAAEKGLGSVSMNMIADKVGIKKPSLYNHFVSKEEIVQAMYDFTTDGRRLCPNEPTGADADVLQSNLFRTLHPANGSKDHGRRDRADDPCHETVILCNGNP